MAKLQSFSFLRYFRVLNGADFASGSIFWITDASVSSVTNDAALSKFFTLSNYDNAKINRTSNETDV